MLNMFVIHDCSVGVFKNGRVEIIPNDQGNRITPSYVAFTADNERLIGDAAKNQLTTNPENTVFDAKRLIGRDFTDTTVQHDLKLFPFKANYLITLPNVTKLLIVSGLFNARLLKRMPSLTSRLRHLKERKCLLLKRFQPWFWAR